MQPGTIIESRFEIRARVKSSGRSRVFRGVDLETGREVAIKVLDGMGSHARRFARESDILTELSHAGIVKYVSHGVSGGRLYLVMDWIGGRTLSQQLQIGLTAREAVDVARRIAESLAPVHALGVIHRDIKPSNIMFEDDSLERVIVLDFGIARHVGEGGVATRTGMVLGTPGYMSPEQAVGSRQLDARSDVFSLGCVLYTCLSGRAAFSAAHMPTTLTAILFFDSPALAPLCPEAPPELIGLLERMMAKDPDRRPADAGEVAAALAEFSDLPPGPRRPFEGAARMRTPGVSVTTDSPDTASTQISVTSTAEQQGGAAPVFILASLDPDAPEEPERADGGERFSAPASASGAGAGASSESTGDTTSSGELRAMVRPVRDLITSHHGLSAILADGMFVAMFPTHGDAGDDASAQVERAADCALALRAAVPTAPIVIGQGDAGPVSAVLDRLVESLIEESFRDIFEPGEAGDAGGASRYKPIRLSSRVAEALPDGFLVTQSGITDYLLSRK